MYIYYIRVMMSVIIHLLACILHTTLELNLLPKSRSPTPDLPALGHSPTPTHTSEPINMIPANKTRDLGT